MKIGILQTGHSPEGLVEDFGDYGKMFTHLLAGHGFDFRIWRVVDGDMPPGIHEMDGWLVTGSRHGAYDDLPWIALLEGFLRDAFAAEIPIVGICFGHQVLAQALGGKVEKFSGGWSVGATEYTMGDERLMLNAWHQDQVVNRPEGTVVLGSAENCENAVLAYGDRALSYQPHPEFDSRFVDALIQKRGRGVVPDALLGTARDRLDLPLANHIVANQIAAFFKQPRG